MRGFLNLFGIGVVWLMSVAGWVALGGVTQSRGSAQKHTLRAKVNELWVD